MLFSLVWILAGITMWCVASLAVALVVGPMIRESDRMERRRVQRRRVVRPIDRAARMPREVQLQR